MIGLVEVGGGKPWAWVTVAYLLSEDLVEAAIHVCCHCVELL
jgi:hypothetical protein